MQIDFKFLSAETNRHGDDVLFVRRFGKRVRIKEEKGTEAFAAAYAAAIARLSEYAPLPTQVAPKNREGRKGTLRWLAQQYFASVEFLSLVEKSQGTRRRIIEECLEEPHSDKHPAPMGDCPLAELTPAKIKRLRDIKIAAGLKGAANNRKKYFSALCGWAVEESLLKSNPCRDVKKAQYASNGFHTWTEDEIEQFAQRHPVGTKAMVGLGLLLMLGLRGQDVVSLGRQHRTKGRPDAPYGTIRYVPKKTRYKRVTVSEKPVMRALAEILDAGPCGDLTFLVTEYGKPFTVKGFQNWFRDRCNEAGLPHCTAHGLKKAGATICAENGASALQLMALFNWSNIKEAQPYIEAANRKKAALSGGVFMPGIGVKGEHEIVAPTPSALSHLNEINGL